MERRAPKLVEGGQGSGLLAGERVSAPPHPHVLSGAGALHEPAWGRDHRPGPSGASAAAEAEPRRPPECTGGRASTPGPARGCHRAEPARPGRHPAGRDPTAAASVLPGEPASCRACPCPACSSGTRRPNGRGQDGHRDGREEPGLRRVLQWAPGPGLAPSGAARPALPPGAQRDPGVQVSCLHQRRSSGRSLPVTCWQKQLQNLPGPAYALDHLPAAATTSHQSMTVPCASPRERPAGRAPQAAKPEHETPPPGLSPTSGPYRGHQPLCLFFGFFKLKYSSPSIILVSGVHHADSTVTYTAQCSRDV